MSGFFRRQLLAGGLDKDNEYADLCLQLLKMMLDIDTLGQQEMQAEYEMLSSPYFPSAYELSGQIATLQQAAIEKIYQWFPNPEDLAKELFYAKKEQASILAQKLLALQAEKESEVELIDFDEQPF